MAERKKIASNFEAIKTLVIDESYSWKIIQVCDDIKAKGTSLDSPTTFALKNIITKALKKVDESLDVTTYWADKYDASSIVKIKVLLNHELNIGEGSEEFFEKLKKIIIKDLKIKQLSYGYSNKIPAIIIWM